MRTWSHSLILAVAACGPASSGTTSSPSELPGEDPPGEDGNPACGDGGGIAVPDGFCATVFADDLGHARHLAVTPSGDVFVAIQPARGTTEPGTVIFLRDGDADGVAEERRKVLDWGGNGIAWADGALYVAAADRVSQFLVPDGEHELASEMVVVGDLPATGDHAAKTVVPIGDQLYVNFGSASNACQEQNRVLHSPGVDPCPELPVRAGVWAFPTTACEERATPERRFASGLRNSNALAADANGALWAAVNGRDQLNENWPELFTAADDMDLPAEILVRVDAGADYGWPYCYWDPNRGANMLAPEYGGDGETEGRCAAIAPPALALPAHWAPLGMVFYDGEMFPERFRGGAFIANHGSRFDAEAVGDPGYNVVFVPFENGAPRGTWEDFATDFTAGLLPLPDAAPHRPVGLAVMPDGSLLISDDKGGRIWRVTYAGE
jgi:glucose/arabinose dehydrogenase